MPPTEIPQTTLPLRHLRCSGSRCWARPSPTRAREIPGRTGEPGAIALMGIPCATALPNESMFDEPTSRSPATTAAAIAAPPESVWIVTLSPNLLKMPVSAAYHGSAVDVVTLMPRLSIRLASCASLRARACPRRRVSTTAQRVTVENIMRSPARTCRSHRAEHSSFGGRFRVEVNLALARAPCCREDPARTRRRPFRHRCRRPRPRGRIAPKVYSPNASGKQGESTSRRSFSIDRPAAHRDLRSQPRGKPGGGRRVGPKEWGDFADEARIRYSALYPSAGLAATGISPGDTGPTLPHAHTMTGSITSSDVAKRAARRRRSSC